MAIRVFFTDEQSATVSDAVKVRYDRVLPPAMVNAGTSNPFALICVNESDQDVAKFKLEEVRGYQEFEIAP